MEFPVPQFKKFSQHLIEIAKKFSLNPEKLRIEFYAPNTQAILIERNEDVDFKIHINLQENRIISVQRLSKNGNDTTDRLKEKYRRFMK
ncbi:MAG: hypothetical protein E2O78_02790 [Caldithrix sp.]|nr:MAG: hypothetical protein E2O78_02790 [Caldithrix sp.]